MYDLAFPHLNIFIEKLRSGFEIFNFHIVLYDVIVVLGMITGFFVAIYLAKKLWFIYGYNNICYYWGKDLLCNVYFKLL